MLIFRVPDEIADEVGKLVGQQSKEKDKASWTRGLGATIAGAADVSTDKVLIEVQPDVDHNYKNPSAPDRFVVSLQGKSYPGNLLFNAKFIADIVVRVLCSVLMVLTPATASIPVHSTHSDVAEFARSCGSAANVRKAQCPKKWRHRPSATALSLY